MQIGQRDVVLSPSSIDGDGGKTVRMGNMLVAEKGGPSIPLSLRESGRSPFSSANPVFFSSVCFGLAAGTPSIVGGGNSSPSLAFLLNCLEKSELCHHSKNLSAKMLVGSNNFNAVTTLGCKALDIVLGEKILLVCPGLAAGPLVTAGGSNANAIAL